jgi:hypothetical protein
VPTTGRGRVSSATRNRAPRSARQGRRSPVRAWRDEAPRTPAGDRQAHASAPASTWLSGSGELPPPGLLRARLDELTPRRPVAPQPTCFPILVPSGCDISVSVIAAAQRSHAPPPDVDDRCCGKPQASAHVPRLLFISVPAAAPWLRPPIPELTAPTFSRHAASLSPAMSTKAEQVEWKL